MAKTAAPSSVRSRGRERKPLAQAEKEQATQTSKGSTKMVGLMTIATAKAMQ